MSSPGVSVWGEDRDNPTNHMDGRGFIWRVAVGPAGDLWVFQEFTGAETGPEVPAEHIYAPGVWLKAVRQ